MGEQESAIIIQISNLEKFCEEVLIKERMKLGDAQITAELLSTTDGYGTYSHGTKNLQGYIRKIKAGGINLDGNYEIISKGLGYNLIDANSMIGMVPAYNGMKLAIEKAKNSGIACTVVRNATYFGPAGFYANMAAKEDMIGLVFSNVDTNMTIPRAKGNAILFLYPGEIEWDKYNFAVNNGITLPKDVEQSLLDLEKESGISIDWD